MIKVWVYSGIYILGVIISALAQILLKKSANIERENKIKEYKKKYFDARHNCYAYRVL